MNIIHTCRPKTGSITVSKFVTDHAEDATYFHVTLTGSSAEPTVVSGYVQQGTPITFTELPFDTYTVTEVSETGYTLDSITPNIFVIDKDNLHHECEIVNVKFEPVYPTSLTIKKDVHGAVVDYTVFHVNIIGDNGIEYMNVPISVAAGILLESIPFGTYTVTEESEAGYVLDSITPSVFVIDKDNLHHEGEIVNVKFEPVKYGALYNGFDVANIARNGFEVPADAQFTTLGTYLGGNTVAGGVMKEIELTYWISPNTGASNGVLFNARGCGTRDETTGAFSGINAQLRMLTKTAAGALLRYRNISYNSASLDGTAASISKKQGASLRLIKTTPTDADLLKADGESCEPYFDGEYYYRTVKIGTQVWTDNIKTRYYADGTPIPVVTDNTTWAALTTAGMCYYNNDETNA